MRHVEKSSRLGMSSGPALRLIAAGGLAVFLILFLMAWGLKQGLKPQESQRPQIRREHSPFDGRRAFADLEKVVALGPRTAGSQAAESCRAMIKRALGGAGLTVREHRFEAQTPAGAVPMTNVYGIVEGTEPGVIILSNHYDTKRFSAFEFVGANDGGSTTAWMMEMARALGGGRDGRSVWLVFFDGEEAFETWSAEDGLYGSRAFAAHLEETGRLGEVAALINVDMIGDRYLGINQDPGAPAYLRETIWRAARDLGYGKHFLAVGSGLVEDDHIPFREAGVPAINLIDFSYGGSIAEHRRTWHTAADTLDKVGWESLQVVGDVLYAVLPELDAVLDRVGSETE